MHTHNFFSKQKKSELSTSSQERDTMENCILLLHYNVRTYVRTNEYFIAAWQPRADET